VVCSGFTQGLHLVLAALASAGHTQLGIEDPGHQDWAPIARRAGLRPAAVPVDADGARARSAPAGVRAAVLPPAHQTPTGTELTGLAGGFPAVLRLPAGADEAAIARAASERGIGIYPMSRYGLGAPDHPPQLVLGFGDLTEVAIRRGIATIGDLLGT
jgi:DNA-binding transcriptional MocR family regulator